MDITKDTKIIKISAYAEGEYSKAVAYGESLLPYEMLDKVEDFNGTEICVNDLDGKHGDVYTELKVEVLTVEKLTQEHQVNSNMEIHITDYLLDSEDTSNEDVEQVDKFTSMINKTLKQTKTDDIKETQDKKDKLLVLYSVPDLTEGRYGYKKIEIFKIKEDSQLDNAKKIRAIRLIAENLLSETGPKYDGVMGSAMDIRQTFSVEIEAIEEREWPGAASYAICINHDVEIRTSKIGTSLTKATEYVKKIIAPAIY